VLRVTCRVRRGSNRSFRFVVAGSAGAKVRSTVRLVANAAVLFGLWVTQRDDYPVTVKSGHCVSALVLAQEEIQLAGIETPDALLVLSADGAAKVGRHLSAMRRDDRVFVLPGISLPATRAAVTTIDPAAAAVRPADRAPRRHGRRAESGSATGRGTRGRSAGLRGGSGRALRRHSARRRRRPGADFGHRLGFPARTGRGRDPLGLIQV